MSYPNVKPDPPATILVAYAAEPIADLDHYFDLPPINPPKSADTEEKKLKWWDKTGADKLARQERMRQEAAYSKLTGRITHIMAVDPQGRKTFDSDKMISAATPDPAAAFAKVLLADYPEAFPDLLDYSGPRGVRMFGWGLKPFVRLLGVQCAMAGFPVPLSLWYRNDAVYDPYEVLVEADRRAYLPLDRVFDMFGVTPDTPPGVTWQVGKNLREDLRLAAELVYRFGLCGSPAGTASVKEVIAQLQPQLVEETEPEKKQARKTAAASDAAATKDEENPPKAQAAAKTKAKS